MECKGHPRIQTCNIDISVFLDISDSVGAEAIALHKVTRVCNIASINHNTLTHETTKTVIYREREVGILLQIYILLQLGGCAFKCYHCFILICIGHFLSLQC